MYNLALTLAALFTKTKGILEQIITVLFVAATVVFLWGMIQYILAAGEEKKIGEARKRIVVGLIGLFMMVAMWGIVKVITNTFFGP